MPSLRDVINIISCIPHNRLFFKIFLMFIFERKSQSASGGGAEREGDTESGA